KKKKKKKKKKSQNALTNWLRKTYSQKTKLEQLQICHRVLFCLLHDVYDLIKAYKEKIFQELQVTLGIEYVIRNGEIEAEEENNARGDNNKKWNVIEINKKTRDTTRYICQFYLRKYHERLLPYFEHRFNDQTLGYWTNKIQQLLTSELGHCSLSQCPEGVLEYIEAVKKWSWCALLQEPELQLFPRSLKFAEQKGQPLLFDEKIHKKTYGSDSNGSIVAYCVWPCLAQNDIQINDVMMEVFVKNESL
ncbi:hypothetical protein RFI_27047, partial [Reticulomyxa filosa]